MNLAAGLRGKKAIVTGGSRGIGRRVAERFAEEGASVLITGRNDRDVEATVRALAGSGEVWGLAGDVADADSVKRIVAAAVERWGRIDVLVNNAGIVGKAGPLLETEDPEWEDMLAINLTGAFRFAREVGRRMVEDNGGVIVALGSIYAHGGDIGAGAYGITKAGLAALTRSLAGELGPHGVRCLTVSAGWVESPSFEAAMGPETVARLRGGFGRAPLRRPVTIDEVAEACVFAAEDRAAGISGSEIVVDGGILADLHIGPTVDG